MDVSALIIGCGSIGSRHAKNLSSFGVELLVHDLDTDTRDHVADKVRARAVNSVEDGLEEDPDMVLICTPSNHHIEPATKAARAGCDLYVEKPLSNTAEGVDQLLDIVKDRDLVSMIGCNYRFHPAILTVRDILQKDFIGDVISARIQMGSYLPDWHPWEDYREMYSAQEGVGGVLLDTVHGINYGRWFFGDETTVTAMLGFDSSLEIETEDTVSMITRYDNDLLCEYHFDYVQRIPIRTGHITGEHGSIRWGGVEDRVYRYDPDQDEWIVACDYSDWEINQMYIDMLEHFLECVQDNKETTSPLTDGWKDLRLVLAAKQSFRDGVHVDL